MQATPVQSRLSLHPLQLVNPEVWEYTATPRVERVEESVEGWCAYIWRVFVAIITCTIFSEGWPRSLSERRVIRETRETFKSTGYVGQRDIEMIIAYLHSPFKPICVDHYDRAFDIFSRLGQNRTPFHLTSISTSIGHRSHMKLLLDQNVLLEEEGAECEDGLYPSTDPHTYVLVHDIRSEGQLRHAFEWLGLNDNAAAVTTFNRVLNELFQGNNRVVFPHCGYWIVHAAEDRNGRSLRFMLHGFGREAWRNSDTEQRNSPRPGVDHGLRALSSECGSALTISSFFEVNQVGYEVRIPPRRSEQ